MKIVDNCERLCAYIESEPTPNGVESRWHEIFSQVCRLLGFNKSATKILWKELAYGNWKHLHETDEECNKSAEEWLDDFSSDVFYCSDRWTLDRLMRCHWQFRQWKRRIKAVGDWV